jgi:hypothetical protein
MDNTASFNREHRTISRVRRVIQVCDSFEDAWRAGQQPQIEQYLEQADDLDSSLLLPELIMVELELRRQAGEKPTPQEYRQRFPEHGGLIEGAFHSGPPRQSHPLEADVQTGDFKIVKRLGAGGMGIVYLARQMSLNRLVAPKVLGPES